MTAKPSESRHTHDDDLPEFENPPLAEVALGIQFDPLVGLSSAHFGEVWGLFRDQFPSTVDQLPLAPVFERLEAPFSDPRSLQIDLGLLSPALPRCWFISSDDDELLQFQQDRFHHNWRRREGRTTYPRYPTIRSKFEAEAKQLAGFIEETKIGAIEVNQCEVSYVNHIVSDENPTEHSQAGRVLRLLAGEAAVPLGRQEHVRHETAFLILDDSNQSRGRLHVSLVSGFLREGSKRMFALTLTARGAPMGAGVAGALEFLDLGRRWIVRGFTDLTTDEMHRAWRRKR